MLTSGCTTAICSRTAIPTPQRIERARQELESRGLDGLPMGRLILPRAKAPQPDHDIHGAHTRVNAGTPVRICPRGLLVTARSYYHGEGAGRSTGRAGLLSSELRHWRPAGEVCSRQCRPATRSDGIVRESRQRAGGAARRARLFRPAATSSLGWLHNFRTGPDGGGTSLGSINKSQC
jgi:hypothetical protein